ncbi:MAG: hypothetical protein WC224_03635 [Sphaerochaetaceae bacterium]
MKRSLVLLNVKLSIVMLLLFMSPLYLHSQHAREPSLYTESVGAGKYIGNFDNFEVEVALSSFADEQWHGCLIKITNNYEELFSSQRNNVLRFSFNDGPVFSFLVSPFKIEAKSSTLLPAMYLYNQDFQARNILKTGIVFLMTLMELSFEGSNTPDAVAMMKAIVSVEFDFEGKSYELLPSNSV